MSLGNGADPQWHWNQWKQPGLLYLTSKARVPCVPTPLSQSEQTPVDLEPVIKWYVMLDIFGFLIVVFFFPIIIPWIIVLGRLRYSLQITSPSPPLDWVHKRSETISSVNLSPHNLAHWAWHREGLDTYLWNCYVNVEVNSKEASELHLL